MGEVSGAAFGFIFTSRPTLSVSVYLFTRSLVHSFSCMSFPPPLLPPEDGRAHFRAREPKEGEGHGAEHRDVREHGFRDVRKDIEPNVGEGVDMHAILLGHVVPVRVNRECDGEGKKRDKGEGARGAGRGGHGGLGDFRMRDFSDRVYFFYALCPGGVLAGSYTMHVRADAASRQNVGYALRSHHT